MIFDDGEEVINCARFESLHSSKDDIFSHEQDPEVSRLFTSSPPLHVAAASYNDYSLIKMDTITAGDDDDSTKTKKKDDVGKAAAPGNRLLKLLGNPDSNSSDIFAKCAIPPKPVIPTVEDGQENSAPISALTAMLTDPKKRQKNNVASADSSEVTIYLPDRGEMTLSLKYTNTVQQTIRIILKKHKNEGIRPALQYGQPEQYELRLHEGDGLPDEDFDLEGEKQLIEYGKETEYCLCDAFDDDFEMAKVIDASGAGRETVVPDSIRGSMGIGGARANNVVSVFIHHMAPLNIVVESPTKTLRDLLLTIAKKHRLRLYTDTFEFVVNQDEKERLQLALPVLDMDMVIQAVGLKEIELRKKCFADASKSVVGTGSKYNNMHGGGPSGGGTGKRSGTSGGKDSHSGPNTSSNDVSNPIMHPSNTHHSHFAHHSSSTTRTFTDKYTDATAAIYEEWFVIKKNKFGIKQERTFGIDSRSIFNAKRSDGGKASDRNNVRLAQRDIDDIIKFEKVEGTDKTFRITWQEDNIQYAIEYACESERDCTQIIKKLTYIRNARNRQK